LIAKYNAAGNVLWARSAGGNADDYGQNVTTDASGNVYITGYFVSSTITFGSTTLINTGNADIFIAKYDDTGNVLWAKSVGGTGIGYGYSVCTDASGSVFITGHFTSTSIIFGTTTLTNVGGADVFIAKYDTNGNVLWAKSAGGNTNDYGASVSTDGIGNLYVLGYFDSPSITFGSTTLTNTGSYDVFIAKYDANGSLIWAKSVGGTGDDKGNSITTDASDNVYVTGSFGSPTIPFGSTILNNAISTGSSDIFIAKYEAAGTVLWAKALGGTSSDFGSSVTTDASGNVFMSGRFTSLDMTFDSNTLNNAGNFDILIVEYDAIGTALWANSAGGNGADYGFSVATDASGNLYMSGRFNSSAIIFGSSTLTNAGTTDIFIAKYTGTGTGVNKMIGNNNIKISPNPISSTITITIPKSIYANITITNLTGKQVATYNLQNTTIETIDVSNLPEGVYFVSLKSDEGVITKKIVKTN
jgi:hypothetical protein